ncbi:aspartyl/asparaginyl beta-hydroxylase domain-containing protein [Adhaeribacter soli]|uniref:Aspartyl/asparaginyl beta-hydroxylase domain-containing protein n=1 Tax=Adhaeribacter soli TaxID=2607655 RepID=A0A5N1IWX4_9BACT|nr:aspartyl/asparaginyl beta-hydroxylase domain-containing protein [Adhaeribacter soli]KAA9339015.1 aspartyl/asparaginyl beta-hydroxylase domain-containing protein [Adhaeribacter soli]
MIRFARLPLTANIREIQKEVNLLLNNQWLPHYNRHDYEGSWDVLVLRGLNGNSQQAFADQVQHGDFANTEILAQCPEIERFLNSLACEKRSVRLLNLKSGAVIKEHRDLELAFENGEARLHIPVFTNPKVAFYLDNHLLKMQEGECWYINANLPHRLSNKGQTDRIHLVIDCEVNDWLRSVFQHSESAANMVSEKELWDREKELKRQTIQNLRLQNTEATLTLAATLEQEFREKELAFSDPLA